MKRFNLIFHLSLLTFSSQLWAQTPRVVDIPTRPSVTQRMVVLEPDKPKVAVVLFAGGHGGLLITSNGIFLRYVQWHALWHYLNGAKRLMISEMAVDKI